MTTVSREALVSAAEGAEFRQMYIGYHSLPFLRAKISSTPRTPRISYASSVKKNLTFVK